MLVAACLSPADHDFRHVTESVDECVLTRSAKYGGARSARVDAIAFNLMFCPRFSFAPLARSLSRTLFTWLTPSCYFCDESSVNRKPPLSCEPCRHFSHKHSATATRMTIPSCRDFIDEGHTRVHPLNRGIRELSVIGEFGPTVEVKRPAGPRQHSQGAGVVATCVRVMGHHQRSPG